MSLGYQREATTFLALLTLFAIALYLLGQALGMGRTSAAFILVLFACGLVVAGVLRGVFIRVVDKAIVLKPATAECRLPNEIADNDLVELAAEHFARGWVLYEGSGDDPAELAKAAKEFGCAAQIRPTFAAANLYFARATNARQYAATERRRICQPHLEGHLGQGLPKPNGEAGKHANGAGLRASRRPGGRLSDSTPMRTGWSRAIAKPGPRAGSHLAAIDLDKHDPGDPLQPWPGTTCGRATRRRRWRPTSKPSRWASRAKMHLWSTMRSDRRGHHGS